MYRVTMCLLLVSVCGAIPASDLPPPREVVDVATLVRRLGSEDFTEREEASRRLSTLNVDAPPPELLAALESENPEVQQRATRAVKTLREHIARNRELASLAKLPRGERFARLGRIDLYVASTAGTEWKSDDDRMWAPTLEIMKLALSKAGLTGERKPNYCAAWDDFKTFRSTYTDMRFIRTEGVYAPPEGYWRLYQRAVQCAGMTESEGFRGLLVSRGPVRTKGPISEAVILATGDVTCEGHHMSSVIVICDGDVVVKEHALTCLIIARGKITVGETAPTCNLIAGKTVTIGKPRKPDDPGADEYLKAEIEEHATKPLGYITFFELFEVGIAAKATEGGVQLTSVAEAKPFATAGAKVGDIVTAVGGKKPDTPESLRRLLRDALALGDATVTLKRGNDTLTVKVALPE